MNQFSPNTMVVDGDYFLHRVMHVGDIANMKDSQGRPTGGAFGMLQTLHEALKKFPGVRKLIVVFDTGHSARRLELFPEYKANRKVVKEGKEEEEAARKAVFAIQKDLCMGALPYFGARLAVLPCKEGDDILGWYARTLTEDLVVATEDKDLLQLVNRHVGVYQPIKNRFVSVHNFSQEAKVCKPLFLVRKAIIGDPSDNIDGVKSVGKVTVDRLMATATDYLVQRRANTGQELLRLACETQMQTDTRNRKRYQRIMESSDVIVRNMRLMDVRLETFSDEEEQELHRTLDAGAGVFQEREALGFLSEMEFKQFKAVWAAFSRPFRLLG
jgi:DNA polymerase-1